MGERDLSREVEGVVRVQQQSWKLEVKEPNLTNESSQVSVISAGNIPQLRGDRYNTCDAF